MKINRRHFLRAGGGAALLATTGCDQLPGLLFPGDAGPATHWAPFQAPSGESIDLVTHVLQRLSFGIRPGDDSRVRKLGADGREAVQAYVEEQLAPERIDDHRCQKALRRCDAILDQPAGELFEYQPKFLLSQMIRATVLRAVYSERQLYELMVQFWTDHFNIDASKGDCQWLKAADDREVIRQHALGQFPALLRASALSPAMLWYLDGRVNRRRTPADRPNENYARELLELHTLGVHGGYTQRDVMEVARCLTGWTVRSKEPFGIGRVEFHPEAHDAGPKVVLGHRIPANLGARDVDRVLDLVALHPATARHLARKLCQRFIADAPPASAVAAVAAAFLAHQGDIRPTLRALFATPAFQESRGNRLKRPFHFVVSALRATGAQTDAGAPIVDYLHRMGQPPFGYPTPDGYPAAASPWLGTLLWRWNFAVALSRNRLQGTRVNFDRLRNAAGGDAGLMAHLLGRQPASAEAEAYHKSGAGLALLLAAPAFQLC